MENSPKRPGRKPAKELTESQARVLREVRDFMVDRGIPPTAKELGDILGVAPATAHEQLGQLVRKGFLRREPNKARGLVLVRGPESTLATLVSVPLVGTIAAGQPPPPRAIRTRGTRGTGW